MVISKIQIPSTSFGSDQADQRLRPCRPLLCPKTGGKGSERRCLEQRRFAHEALRAKVSCLEVFKQLRVHHQAIHGTASMHSVGLHGPLTNLQLCHLLQLQNTVLNKKL